MIRMSFPFVYGIAALGISGLLFFSNPAVSQAQKSDNFGVGKKTKRQKFKSLRFKFKKKKKTQFKFKRKKTARELRDEKLRAQAKKKVVKKASKSNELSAFDDAKEKEAAFRKKKIELYKKALPGMQTLTAEDRKLKANMYYQLAEEYWEESKYQRFKAMRAHNKVAEKWDRECRKLDDVKKCPPQPKPNLELSNGYRVQAIGVYKRVLKLFKNYHRAPEVTFILALNLMETKRHKQGLKAFANLIKKYPKSRYIPDAYMAIADYYFNKNKVNDAMDNYKNAIKTSRARYTNPKTAPDRKISMRGVHLRSTYMLAWGDFNVGEYERALRRFKKVIKLSIRYEKTKESKIILKNEALRDLVLTFSKMDATIDAYRYFKTVMGARYAYVATKKLASRYYRQGNYLRSVATYRLLMGLNPKGEKDKIGPEAPIFQNEIVRSVQRIWVPTKIYKEVLKLTAFLEDDNRWAGKWRGNKKVYSSVGESIEQTLLEFSTKYHQLGQKFEKKKKEKRSEMYYDFAVQLYEQYLRYFPKTESAYELRFFWAELLYRKAQKVQGRSKKISKAAKKYYAQAARQYNRVTQIRPNGRKGQYLKQSAFAEILCYEALAGRSQAASIRGGGKRLQGLRKDKNGKITWDRIKIKKGSWDARLLLAYERYLKIVKNKEERLQTFFKTGTIYYSYKYYLKSMDIFLRMAKEFPNHELSRRAAFMILYSYEDLKQWKELEKAARIFIVDKILTRKKAFKTEMYNMLIRSAFIPYLRRFNAAEKAKKVPALELGQHFMNYEKEFGVQGPWKKKGFAVSPRADNALAVAGLCYTKNKRILKAIQARERLVKVYPKSKLVPPIIYDLGGHYEQIANYAVAAQWFERYAFKGKDYMKDETSEDDKAKAKKKKKRRRRRRRRKAKKKVKKETTDKAKTEKLKRLNNAIYKSAAYRRGLGQFDRAIKLYRHFIKRFPKDKESADLFLAIAQLYKESKRDEKALATYNEYLGIYQKEKVAKYLKKAVRLFKSNFSKTGIFTRHIKYTGKRKKADPGAAVQKKLGKLTKAEVEEAGKRRLLFVHASIADIFRKQKKATEMEHRYAMVDALGYQMYNYRVKAMHGVSIARTSYAKAKFFLVEHRRKAFAALKFKGKVRADKRILKQIIKGGRELARDYSEVANLQSPEWVLAAVFRMGEIYHLFVKKLYAAPVPTYLSGEDKMKYKMFMENFAARFEEPAIDAYENVLKKSAELGLYNEWVRRCEKAKNELTRKSGRINPYTIFSRRKAAFWLVEPNPLDLDLKNFKMPVKKRAIPKMAPAKRALKATSATVKKSVMKEKPVLRKKTK